MPITSTVDSKQYVIPVELGGTGATSRDEAATNLGIYTTADLDQPSGLISLDINKEPNVNLINEAIPIVIVSVTGPKYLVLDQEAKYLIVNYDDFTEYSIEAISGGVERNGKIITYTAPTVVGKSGFIINGNIINIDILETQLLPPKITNPLNTSVNVKSILTITADAFTSLGVNDTHKYTDWELATDADFQIVVFRSLEDEVNLTSIEVDLINNTTYYVRARYHGVATGPSRWGDAVRFKTSVNRFLNVQSLYPAGLPGYDEDNIYHGNALAMTKDGKYIFSGSEGLDVSGLSNVGKVTVYKRVDDEYVYLKHITMPTPLAEAKFGSYISCSYNGDRVFISAPFDKKDTTVLTGSVYVFTMTTEDNWDLEEKITAANFQASAGFGTSSACNHDGSILIVGAPRYDSDTLEKVGQICIYERNVTTWNEVKTITTNTANTLFGSAVTLNKDGTIAIVGSPGIRSVSFYQNIPNTGWDNVGGILKGSVEEYGRHVTISDNERFYAVSGLNANGSENRRGVVFVSTYEYDTNGVFSIAGFFDTTIIPNDPQPFDYFGSSVVFKDDGTLMAIGSPSDDGGGFLDNGSVYIYELMPASNSSWNFKEKRVMGVVQSDARYGRKLAMDANARVIAVGMPFRDLNTQINAGGVSILK